MAARLPPSPYLYPSLFQKHEIAAGMWCLPELPGELGRQGEQGSGWAAPASPCRCPPPAHSGSQGPDSQVGGDPPLPVVFVNKMGDCKDVRLKRSTNTCARSRWAAHIYLCCL